MHNFKFANMLHTNSLVIFSCFIAKIIAENNSTGFVRFTKVYDFRQNTCEQNDQAFEISNLDLMACGFLCIIDADCKSFFYFPTSLRCDGCTQTYSTYGQLKEVGEQTIYYTLTASTGYSYIGCFARPCEREQGGCFNILYTLRDVYVADCFDFCDMMEDRSVSAVAIEIDVCYCEMVYAKDLLGNCNTTCADNEDEMCGGGKAVSVHERN